MFQVKIVEILLILMGEIRKSGMVKANMELISDELLNQGFSQQEISTAFSWILERTQEHGETITPRPQSFRVMHELERIFISKEAYGFLLQLYHIGLLTYDDFEKVIERSLLESTPQLDIEGIKLIIAEILFGESSRSNLSGDFFIPDDLVQ